MPSNDLPHVLIAIPRWSAPDDDDTLDRLVTKAKQELAGQLGGILTLMYDEGLIASGYKVAPPDFPFINWRSHYDLDAEAQMRLTAARDLILSKVSVPVAPNMTLIWQATAIRLIGSPETGAYDDSHWTSNWIQR
jgi:hypothetical protein